MKKGKSFNATMVSLILSNTGGCHFPVGDRDMHVTSGVNYCPPLEVKSSFIKPKNIKNTTSLKRIMIFDMEGFERDDIVKKI